MIVLSFVDLAVMRLPHRITAATTAGFLSQLAASSDPRAWWRAAAAGMVLAALFIVLAVASRGQLGWGDVAVAVPVAAGLGWHSSAGVEHGDDQHGAGVGTAAFDGVSDSHERGSPAPDPRTFAVRVRRDGAPTPR
jgi:leader peptidase (prepilin peptidase)/N-methyltransferase